MLAVVRCLRGFNQITISVSVEPSDSDAHIIAKAKIKVNHREGPDRWGFLDVWQVVAKEEGN